MGDVVGYTALAERDGEAATAAAVDEPFASLGDLLATRGATTRHRDGDWLFAAWDVTADPRFPLAGERRACDEFRASAPSEVHHPTQEPR